ncbi:hypothetical protein [Cellulomonas cellasea]|uniref:Uncharacterized protein n=1 Tax=Cellulomonas cellasea TaxID=43670 RepID=A0A7W4UCB0_9CELL|nr:hypothetical protein [Cellulomonas cellasea]MBB2921586.1 hypothetical protein [Cellulomonas cellasea]
MAHHGWTDDETLLTELRAALGPGARVDERQLEAARAAFTWRTVDAELASLTYDSLLDDRVLVRGTATAPRSLVFDSVDLTVELEVTAGRVVGQLVPPGPGEVALETESAQGGPVPTDDAGCFTLATDPGARIRLRCTTPTTTVVTDWVRT